jgi:hypothetical protein
MPSAGPLQCGLSGGHRWVVAGQGSSELVAATGSRKRKIKLALGPARRCPVRW